MNICNDGHDEVCYEVETCPACRLIGRLEAMLDEIESLKDALRDAEAVP